MSIKELKQEIAKHELSAKTQQEELDSIRSKIIEEAKPFVREQLKQIIDNEVRRNPEHTKELGRESLSAMKQRLLTLTDNSDQLVEEILGENSLWLHIGYTINTSQNQIEQIYNNKKTAENQIRNGFKMALGEAAKILVDNGYAKVGTQYQWYTDHLHSSTSPFNNPKRLLYKYSMRFPRNIEDLISEYIKKLEELHETINAISNLKRKLDEQEAVDLWDSV